MKAADKHGECNVVIRDTLLVFQNTTTMEQKEMRMKRDEKNFFREMPQDDKDGRVSADGSSAGSRVSDLP